MYIFLFFINTAHSAQKLIILLIHSDNEAMINKGSRNRVENGRNCTIAINLAYAGRQIVPPRVAKMWKKSSRPAAVERNFSGGMNSRSCKIKDAGARISRWPA